MEKLNIHTNTGFFYLLSLLIIRIGGTAGMSGYDFLSDKNPEPSDSGVELIHKETESRVDVYIDGKHFTSYLYPDDFKKPVLYPVNTADGTPVTRGFPLEPRPGERTDHPHHVGLWLNYGDVNGLDFWNNSDEIPPEREANYGSIYHRSIDKLSNGDSEGELAVTLEWAGPDGEVLLEEHTTFIFSGSENKRVIDRITRLTALHKPVVLDDNKEGMLGLRVRRELEHPDEHPDGTGIYTSSEGLEGYDVWGTRARWVYLSGQINDETVAAAILDHPDNVGYPTYWHARGYGLFAANPLGQRALSDGWEELNFSLAAGESVTFQHRVMIYTGNGVTDERVDSDWHEFAGR